MPIHLSIGYGSFYISKAESSSFGTLTDMQSLKYLLCGHLQKKFANPWTNQVLNTSTQFFIPATIFKLHIF